MNDKKNILKDKSFIFCNKNCKTLQTHCYTLEILKMIRSAIIITKSKNL